MKAWIFRDTRETSRDTDPKGLALFFAIDSPTNVPGHKASVGYFHYRPHAEIVLEALKILRANAKIPAHGIIGTRGAVKMRERARKAMATLEAKERFSRGGR